MGATGLEQARALIIHKDTGLFQARGTRHFHPFLREQNGAYKFSVPLKTENFISLPPAGGYGKLPARKTHGCAPNFEARRIR
jgi:hypothetical protein